MFGIQGGYLGNTAGMIRGMSVPGEREAAGELMRRMGGAQLPMASMGGMPGAIGNMAGLQAAGFSNKTVS